MGSLDRWEIGELAEIIAGDMADLRNALERSPPFVEELSHLVSDTENSLLIVRNRTAARALVDQFDGDVRNETVGGCHVVSMRTLHRTGTWRRAFVVGMPPRWDWHRLDSGISSDLHLLVLGDVEAASCRRSWTNLHAARARWSGSRSRRATWDRLVGTKPPSSPALPETSPSEPRIVGAREFVQAPDPFEAFENLLVPGQLFSEEGPSQTLAEEGQDGEWQAEVEAIKVITGSGAIYLPESRMVDVRIENRLEEVRAGRLEPGMFLIVNRSAGSAGRAGLLDAVAERLRVYRPDLLVANMMIRDLQTSIRTAFRRSGMNYRDIHRRLRALGFDKTYQAARGYVQEDGPIAPRDFPDLNLLSVVLNLSYDKATLASIFRAVKRERSFRRAAGRALADAARKTTLQYGKDIVDDDTGLSIADLQELVLEAKILDVQICESPVLLSETGVLFGE